MMVGNSAKAVVVVRGLLTYSLNDPTGNKRKGRGRGRKRSSKVVEQDYSPHSIDKVLDVRSRVVGQALPAEDGEEAKEGVGGAVEVDEYLVKWADSANIHNTWNTEEELVALNVST